MLYLLDKDTKTVKWNGIPLHEASSAIVKEEVNGDFVLTVHYPITDSGVYQLIKEDMLIKAPVPVLGAQLFRIKKPVENDDNLDITAYHISDDVMQRSIRPVSVVGQGCAMALSQMVQNAKTGLGDFSFASDIMDSRTFNTTETETLYSVLLDGKHSIVGTWEGELVRDNFALTIKRNRGADRGVVITTHKNLKSYQRTKNSQGVVTRIHAKSTFKPDGAEDEVTLRVTVDSPLINSYPYINEKEYENNNAETVEDLRKWAEAKFKNEGIDKVSDAIEIEAYELDGQVIHLGDTVNIKSRKHDVDLYKKAIAYEYNALTEEYISITFDDKPGVGGSGVSSGVSNVADVILSANQNAQEVAIERAVRNANQAFDAEFDKRVEVINDGIEQAKADAELYADNIKQSIDAEINTVNQSMQAQSEEHDRQVADILSKTQSVEELANQAKTDAASAITQALLSKDETIADARAQVATVSQALNTAKADLQNQVNAIDAKAVKVQADADALRTDLNQQAQTLLSQAQAQTALTNRVSTVETLADGTRSTVAELSKTVSKATSDITSVTSRTKTIEDTLSQTRAQYEALTQTVNTQTGQIDSINRKTADLQSGIDGVTERVENLQVGGINLLTDTDEETVYTAEGPVAREFLKTPYDLAKVFDKHGLVTYTLSFDLKADKDGSVYVNQQNGSGARYTGPDVVINVTTKWKRYHVTFTPTEWIMGLSESFLAFYSTYGTGVVPYARKLKLEKGTVPTDWSPSHEDTAQKIAEYKRTADQNYAGLQSTVIALDGKVAQNKTEANQTATQLSNRLTSVEATKTEFQTVKATTSLYERVIGSTEANVKDKIARIVMADSLFMTEVKNKVDGTSTQVTQLADSYAIKNLTNSGTVLNQLNLNKDGSVKIDGNLVQITGTTYIQDGVISSAKIGDLDAGKIKTGTLDAARIAVNSIDGSKLVFDQAFVNKMTADEALFKQLFAQSAFITQVQAVTLSANQITGGLIKATSGAMDINLDNAGILFLKDAKIEFRSEDNTLFRTKNGTSAFIRFRDDSYSGVYAAMGVNADNTGTQNDYASGLFAGVRVIRTNPNRYSGQYVDEIQLIADTVNLRHTYGANNDYLRIKWDGGGRIDLIQFLRAVSKRLGISLV